MIETDMLRHHVSRRLSDRYEGVDHASSPIDFWSRFSRAN
jgi:hypothetical protein